MSRKSRRKKKYPLLLVQRQHFECDGRIHRRLLMERFTFQSWSVLLDKPPRVIAARAADFRATPTIFLAYSNACAFVCVEKKTFTKSRGTLVEWIPTVTRTAKSRQTHQHTVYYGLYWLWKVFPPDRYLFELDISSIWICFSNSFFFKRPKRLGHSRL